MPGLAAVSDQKIMVAIPAAGDFVFGLDVDDPTQSIPKGTMVQIPLTLFCANLQPVGTPNATISDPLTPMTWSHVATDGLQAILGSGTPSSVGTMQSTANWRAAFNAQQATAATDAWTQPNAGQPSALLTVGTDGSGNILALYYAAAGKANGNKAAFWGSPLVTVDHLGNMAVGSIAIGSITGVGALASGSIVPGFGSINIGPSQTLDAGGLTLADGNSHAILTVPIISIANGARHVVMPQATSASRITIRLNLGGSLAVINMEGTIGTIWQPGTTYTNTLTTASKINVQSDGTNIVIENLTGSTVTGTVIIEGTAI